MSFTLNRRQAIAAVACASSLSLLPRHAISKEQMEILVAYFGALTNTGVVAVGLEKGYYDTPVVEVTSVVSSIGGGTAIRNMIGGGVDYGIVGTSAALNAIRSGIDVRIVHGVVRTMEDLLWVSMPDSGISSIEDLKGKKIGFTRPKSISETMARYMIDEAGLTGDIELVSLGGVGAGLSALEAGGVDAALINEPLWSARSDRYQVAFTLEAVPPASQMVGVATRAMMAERPEELRALVGAWSKSANFTYENPEEAGQLMSKRYGADTLPPDVAVKAVKRMADINYWSRGEIEQEGLEMWVEFMRQQDEWEGEADWSNIVDRSFLPSELQ
jgi:NitT/TauT family transport system substrate-binding protein